MKYSIVFFAVLFSFLLSAPVMAEDMPEEGTGPSFTRSLLEFVQPKLEEKDGELIFSVIAENQSDTREEYFPGVEFAQKDGERLKNVVVQRLTESWVFRPREARPIEFRLPTPTFLDGNYRVTLGVVDQLGQLAGRKLVTTRQFSRQSQVAISECTLDGKNISQLISPERFTGSRAEVVCAVQGVSEQASLKLVAKRTKSAYLVLDELGESQVEGLVDEAEARLTLTKELPVGAYRLELSLTDEEGTLLSAPLWAPLLVSGIGGRILGIADTETTSAEKGARFPIAFSYELYGEGEYQTEMMLTSMGEMCGEAQTVGVNTNANLASHTLMVDRDCEQPTVLVRLLSDGVELHRLERMLTSRSSTLIHNQDAMPEDQVATFWERGKSVLWTMLPWLLLGIIILALAWRRLRVAKVLVFLVGAIVMGMWQSPVAEAGTRSFTLNPISGVADAFVNYNFGTDKDTYNPGEQITVDLNIGSADHPVEPLCPVVRIGINGGSYTSDLVTGCYTAQDFRGAGVDLTFTPKFAPGTVGLFNLSFSVGLGSHYTVPVVKHIPLNVAAADPCTWPGGNVGPWDAVATGCNAYVGPTTINVGQYVDVPNTVSGRTGSVRMNCTAAGWSPSNIVCNVAALPALPETFTAAANQTCGSRQINLNWSAVAGAQSYQVYRNGSSKVYDGSGTSFTDTVPSDNTSYAYTITTWNSTGGFSSGSKSASPASVTSASACAASVSGSCGSANGKTYDVNNSVIPNGNRCNTGAYDVGSWGSDAGAWYTTTTFPSDGAPYNTGGADAAYYLGRFWSCDGSGGGTTAGCRLYYQPQCGSADGGTARATPPGNSTALAKIALCAIGTASAVSTNATNYTWSCTNGAGPTDNCSVDRQVSGGSAPTATIQARVEVTQGERSWWQKALAVIGLDKVAIATGSPANISTNGRANVYWSSTGADSCLVSSEKGDVRSTALNNASGEDVFGATLGVGTWTYTITCSNAYGSDTDSVDVVVAAAGGGGGGCCTSGDDDDIPTGLNATPAACDTGRIDISWNAVAGATSYQLRDNGSIVYSEASTSYAHTGLIAGSSHNYSVRAVGPNGTSSSSGSVAATAPSACGGGVPSTPTGLNATPAACDTGRIDISWNAVAGATSYQLRDNGSIVYPGASTSYAHTSLSAGSSHSYTVRATNANGSSSYSGSVAATAPSACGVYPPDAPTGLTATAGTCGTNQITVSWNAAAFADEYELRRNGSTLLIDSVTSYVDRGLAGQVHTYTVRSLNDEGVSPFVGPVMATVPDLCPGQIPETPSPIVLGYVRCDDKITVQWPAVSGATSYQLVGSASYTGSNTFYVHTGITQGNSYQYRVRASNTYGNSNYSGFFNVFIPVDSSCAATTYTITATAGSGGSISPSGAISGLAAGSSRTFTITPNSGYSIASVFVDGTNIGAVGSYTFNNINANHTIQANFTGGGGGTPDLSIIRNDGLTGGPSFNNPTGIRFSGMAYNAFATTPAGVSFSAEVEIDWNNANSCSSPSVDSRRVVVQSPWSSVGIGTGNPNWSSAAYADYLAGELQNGTHCYRLIIDRTGAINEQNEGNNTTPWRLIMITGLGGGGGFVCTGTLPANASVYAGDNTGLSANTPYSYSATNTVSKCQYACNSGYTWNGSVCQGAATTYTITATAGSGGSISPSGAISGLAAGSSRTFTITPNSGYSIASVFVDGTNIGAVGSYTFNNINANHTIQANFTGGGGGCSGPVAPVSQSVVANQFGGAVWGTGPFTTDSDLSTIARFLGAPQNGSALLSITDIGCVNNFASGTQNGVTTLVFGSFRGMNVSCTSGCSGGSGSNLKICPDTNPSIAVGESRQFRAFYNPTGLTTTNCTVLLAIPNWGSSNGNFDVTWYGASTWSMQSGGTYASVDNTSNKGRVTGTSAGSAVIHLNHAGNVTTASVTISGGGGGSGSNLKICPDTNPSIAVGESRQFRAFYNPTGLTTTNCTVLLAIPNWGSSNGNFDVTWYGASTWSMQSGGTYASVDNTSNKGRVTGTSAGSAVIHLNHAGNVTTASVTIAGPPVTVDLKINGSDGPLNLGSGNMTLSWTTSGASSCTATGPGWSGARPTSSAGETIPAFTGTYTLTCTNGSVDGSDSVDVALSCTPSCTEWTPCGPPCSGGDGTQSRTCTTATCLVTPQTQSCSIKTCRDLNWKEIGQ